MPRLGIKFNPNRDRITQVLDALEQTGGHCPCIPKVRYCEDTKCPCLELQTTGKCHCGLFVEEEKSDEM